MPYDVLATSHTPALIIYLLDVSASMRLPLGGPSKIAVIIFLHGTFQVLAAFFGCLLGNRMSRSTISEVPECR